MSRSLAGGARRLWAVGRGSVGGTAVDQLLSTLSNLIISISVSRLAGARELGAFTLVFTTATLLVGFQRSLIADPLLTLPVVPAPAEPRRQRGRAAGAQPSRARLSKARSAPVRASKAQAARAEAAVALAVRTRGKRPASDPADPETAAMTSAVVFALGLACATAIFAAVTTSDIVLLLAVMTPGLLLQDLFRYAAFRRRNAWQAAGLDALWVAGVCLGLPLLIASRTADVGLTVWGLGAWLAVIVHLGRRRTGFSSLGAAKRWWVRDARRMGGLLALDSIVYTAASQAAVYGLAIIVGLRGLGELRSAQIVLGPTGIALTALQIYALPRLAGRAQEGHRRAAALSGAAMLLASLLLIAAIIFAHLLGVQILGAPLRGGLDLLPPLGLQAVLGAATVGPLLSLKALRDVGAYSVTHLLTAAIGVPSMLLTAHLAGLRAAVWVGVGQAALDLLGVIAALRFVERRRSRAVAVASSPSPRLAGVG